MYIYKWQIQKKRVSTNGQINTRKALTADDPKAFHRNNTANMAETKPKKQSRANVE